MQAQILLQIEDSGKFNFVGPLDNKILCYGILHLALEAVGKHEVQEQAAAPTPAPAPAPVPVPEGLVTNGSGAPLT